MTVATLPGAPPQLEKITSLAVDLGAWQSATAFMRALTVQVRSGWDDLNPDLREELRQLADRLEAEARNNPKARSLEPRAKWRRVAADFAAAVVSPFQSEFAQTASQFERALAELRRAVIERVGAEYAAGAAIWAEIGDDDLQEAFHEGRALVAASKADREQ
jgi:hypothetical protein